MQAPCPLAAQATPGPAQPPHGPRGATGVPYPDSRSAAAVPRPAAGRAPAPQPSRATVPAVARHAAPESHGRPVNAPPPPPAHPDPPARSTAPPRTRWPLLADDLFRLAHHDRTGRPLLHASVAGLGLAAALLAELVVAEAIVIESDQVCVVSRTPPPDVLAHTVLGQLAGEVAGHTVRTWLAFLSQTSRERVALRLLRSGHVRPEAGRRLLTRSRSMCPPIRMWRCGHGLGCPLGYVRASRWIVSTPSSPVWRSLLTCIGVSSMVRRGMLLPGSARWSPSRRRRCVCCCLTPRLLSAMPCLPATKPFPYTCEEPFVPCLFLAPGPRRVMSH